MNAWFIFLAGIIVVMAWEMKKMEDRITNLESDLDGTSRVLEGVSKD